MPLKPGPPTPPAEIVRLRGKQNSTASVRHLADVVQPVDQNPQLPVKPPADLKGDRAAQKWWKRVVGAFGAVPVLRTTDEVLVLLLVRSLARMERISRSMRDKEVIAFGEPGKEQIQVNPQYTVFRAERSEVIRLLREIGMSPAARTRLMADNAIAREAKTNAEIAEAKFFGND